MDEINLLDYFNLLRYRWRTLAVTTVLVLCVGIMAVCLLPRQYQGETTLIFPQRSDNSIGGQLAKLSGLDILGSMGSFSGRDVYVTVLKSRTMAEKVIDRHDLNRYGVKVKDLQERLGLQTPKEGGLMFTVTVPTTWLKGHVPGKSVRAESARLSAEITNTYIDELRFYDRSNALFMGRKNRLFVEEQIVRAKADLEKAESRLEDFQSLNPTLMPPDKSSAYAEWILELASNQAQTEVEFSAAERRVASIRSTWNAGAPSGISPDALIDNPTISKLREELTSMEVRRATLNQNLTDNHPSVVSITEHIDKTREKLREEVNRVATGQAASVDPAHQEILKQLVQAEIERDSLAARKSALVDAVADVEKQASQLPVKEIQYVRLLRDQKSAETVYTVLLTEHARAKVAEGKDSDSFIVLDKAVVPEKPSSPRVKLILAVAMVLGMMFGVLVAIVQGFPSGKQPNLRRVRG